MKRNKKVYIDKNLYTLDKNGVQYRSITYVNLSFIFALEILKVHTQNVTKKKKFLMIKVIITIIIMTK